MRIIKRKLSWIVLLVVSIVIVLEGCNRVEKKVGKQSESESESETILMAVGEETVSMEEAKTYVYFLKHQYEGSIGRVIWDYKLEGEALNDYAKEQIQNLLAQIKILKQEAAKQGIELTGDEMEEARSCALDYLSQLSKKEKEESGITQEQLTTIYSENILANKVFEISTNDVDTNISDDEVKQITIQYLMVMTKGTDKNGNVVDMTNEEKKKAKSKAKTLYEKAGDATNFLTFAESNTDAKEAETTFSRADAPKELKEEAFGLKSGEMSKLIEGESGYYIIYCVNDNDEDATVKRKEELIMERQKASFEEKFATWSSEYEIVISNTLWNEIKF
ncbi:MAG: peptidylprolyl isomerase [Velocimicrobium sp.]